MAGNQTGYARCLPYVYFHHIGLTNADFVCLVSVTLVVASLSVGMRYTISASQIGLILAAIIGVQQSLSSAQNSSS